MSETERQSSAAAATITTNGVENEFRQVSEIKPKEKRQVAPFFQAGELADRVVRADEDGGDEDGKGIGENFGSSLGSIAQNSKASSQLWSPI